MMSDNEIEKAMAGARKLHEDIGRLTFEIGCMKTELDAERKTKADNIKMFGDWLEGMIDMELTLPLGKLGTPIYKSCQKYFNKMVAK